MKKQEHEAIVKLMTGSIKAEWMATMKKQEHETIVKRLAKAHQEQINQAVNFHNGLVADLTAVTEAYAQALDDQDAAIAGYTQQINTLLVEVSELRRVAALAWREINRLALRAGDGKSIQTMKEVAHVARIDADGRLK